VTSGSFETSGTQTGTQHYPMEDWGVGMGIVQFSRVGGWIGAWSERCSLTGLAMFPYRGFDFPLPRV